MQRRHLGIDGLFTSPVGLGCMGFSQGYGAADDDESVHAIHAFLNGGGTLLDTAMSYGQGHNEQLVGRALRGRPEAQVATKFGIVRNDDGVTLDGRPDHVREYCTASLRRLGVEQLDLYYLHRVDPDVPIEETVGAMAALVSDGLVRHLGLSEVTPQQLAAACAVHPMAAVQFEWSMLWREPEADIVPAAREQGVGIVPYSPLGRGLLTATLSGDAVAASDFRRSDPRFAAAALDANQRQVATLRSLASSLGISAGQLALAWLLATGNDVVPIPGSRHSARVAENLAAADVVLGPDDLARIDAALPADAWAGDRQSFAVPSTRRGAGTGG